MSEPYTPTTEQVREFWASDGKHLPAAKSYERRASIAEFDRWLDQVKADARREGLAEGWDEAVEMAADKGWLHVDAVADTSDRNPYRQEADHE